MQKTRQALLLMLVIILSISFLATINAQSTTAPTIEWEKAFRPDWGQTVLPMDDGGYILAGTTSQWIQTRGPGNWINSSFNLLKIDTHGNIQWTKNYASIGAVTTVIKTNDNGFAILNRYNLTKMNSQGEIEWTRTYKQFNELWASSVIQTMDDGFAIVGYWSEGGNFVKGIFIKTDSSGNIVWNKTYGEDNSPSSRMHSVIEIDDGYILGGSTTYLTAGDDDMWLLKINRTGDVQWEKRYGGPSEEVGNALIKSPEGGYIFSGYVNSYGYVVRTDSAGNIQWSQTFSKIRTTFASAAQTKEGGYIFAGGNGDSGVVVKYSASGKLQWYQSFPNGNRYIRSVAVSENGSYVLVGTKGLNENSEIWAVKMSNDNLPSETFTPTQTLTPLSTLQAWAVPLTVLIVIVAFIAGLTVLFKRKKKHTNS